jgi:hypothetical protein
VKPTIQDQIACVRREVFMRERVYPARVRSRKMSQQKADTELAAMRAVLKTLTDMAEILVQRTSIQQRVIEAIRKFPTRDMEPTTKERMP